MASTKPSNPVSASAVTQVEAVTEAEKIERYVRRTVATAPPLTEQQRGALADLLREVP